MIQPTTRLNLGIALLFILSVFAPALQFSPALPAQAAAPPLTNLSSQITRSQASNSLAAPFYPMPETILAPDSPFSSAASFSGGVAAGAAHSCVLTAVGGVKCWGRNQYGQLGDGTIFDRPTPVMVSGLSSGVVAIAAGDAHTCALTSSGGLKCWGRNLNGQLGDASNTDRYTPVDVNGLTSGVKAFAAGGVHTCAATTSGAALCWGLNNYGQVGDSSNDNRNTPTAVSGLGSGVQMIAAGGVHTCTVVAGDGVLCWGRNNQGQLGNGDNSNSSVPVGVIGFGTGADALFLGGQHSCALSGGGLKCWGANGSGQLGKGDNTASNTPEAVTGMDSGIVAVAGGGLHTCALTSAGGLKCWGNNTNGQLADGTNSNRNTPMAVIALGSGIRAIIAGDGHTCAQTTGGGVLCWGLNGHYQLGDATTSNRNLPVYAANLGGGVNAVSVGETHACAVTEGGGLKCWGYNTFFQVGDGTQTTRFAPVDVVGLPDPVSAVATGDGHTCALTTAGVVLCWGINFQGQVGDGTFATRSAPTPVSGLGSGVTAIAAGEGHTCALNTSGGVQCWGVNGYFQLGDGTDTNRPTPVAVGGLSSGVSAISPGNDHTCAVTNAGAALCWGRNQSGALGDGTETLRPTPTAVSGLGSGVSRISAGDSHSCAVTFAGSAKCWGSNAAGQLGTGSLAPSSLTPANVVGLSSGVTDIGAGEVHSCAIVSGGGAKCWGDNYLGQLGNGNKPIDSSIPVDVSWLGSGMSDLSAGEAANCALSKGGGVMCWGMNWAYGTLGIGAHLEPDTPVGVLGLGVTMHPLGAGGEHSCVVAANGQVKCWGWNSSYQLGDGTSTYRPKPVTTLGLGSALGKGVVTITTGESHNCVITADGVGYCWGANNYGQLGDGTNDFRNAPAAIQGLGSGLIAISTHNYHTCAVTSAGAVFCWGLNDESQLGDGDIANRNLPTPVSGLSSGVVGVAAGGQHSCALTSAGGVLCWGANNYGQLGDGTFDDRIAPVNVSDLSSGVIAIIAGRWHTCALTNSLVMKCWGRNDGFHLGDGSTTHRNTPVNVSGLPEMQAMSAGVWHSCAITKSSGGAKCWANNDSGQLGDGTITARSTPVDVNGLTSGVRAIAVGGSHTCALLKNWTVQCWGRNTYGQLGNGTTGNSISPMAVLFWDIFLPLLVK